jgi:hypothetical protein
MNRNVSEPSGRRDPAFRRRSIDAVQTNVNGARNVIWPELQFHQTLQNLRPGTPVPEGFVCGDSNRDHRRRRCVRPELTAETVCFVTSLRRCVIVRRCHADS